MAAIIRTQAFWDVVSSIKQGEKEDQELIKIKEDSKIIEVLNGLNRKIIINDVMLKVALSKMDNKEYEDIFHALFDIAADRDLKGSFIILDPEKAAVFAESSFQKKIIKETSTAKLEVCCDLVNEINSKELTKPIAETMMRSGSSPLALSQKFGKVAPAA